MFRELLFRLSQQPRLKSVATRNGIARSMASRFVAGETLPEAIEVVRQINARGMSATLDHLGENVSSRAEAIRDTDATRILMDEIETAAVNCNASVKLTQLGLDLDEELAFENIVRVVEQAALYDNFIRIDMESSEYVERTLRLFARLHEKHRNVGTVIQSYLYRSGADVERLIDMGARVRLVKGAYLESVEVAFQRKGDVDENFIRLMKMLLADGTYPAIATHDEDMIAATKQYARIQKIEPSRYEFQMLYGVRRDLQTRLVAEGHNMRIYVPYGTSWYPYLMRRMAERPANVMFVLGNIAREASVGGRQS